MNREQAFIVLGMGAGLSTAFYLTDFHMLARLNRGLTTWMPSTRWDEGIPFVPEWIWVYLLYFPFCFVPLALREFWAGDSFHRAVKGFLMQFAAALSCFWLVPSRMLQASPGSSTWSEAAVAAFYSIDPGFNVFPSLHVANAAFVACLLWRLKGPLIGAAAWGAALLITVSTLFVKQHYLADLAAGLVLGCLSYHWAFARERLSIFASRALSRPQPAHRQRLDGQGLPSSDDTGGQGMNTRNRVVTTLVVMAVGGALGAALVSRQSGELAGRVSDRSKVCMVNDKVMGQAQLPVVVSGKTYYGCCAGCVGRLNTDRKARVAADPVTGRDVDKSEAVILRGEGGEALYFESEETARRYRERATVKS